jgi:hypothetical protein
VIAKNCREKSTYDFLLWDYLKNKMFKIFPADMHNLKQKISDDIDAIPPAMLHGVVRNTLNDLHQCVNLDGRHVTGVTLRSNSFIMFLNNGKYLSTGSHCFE